MKLAGLHHHLILNICLIVLISVVALALKEPTALLGLLALQHGPDATVPGFDEMTEMMGGAPDESEYGESKAGFSAEIN